MAQMAGRASVEFYVGLALKARGEKQKSQKEDAFVIRTFRNGLAVFVSKCVVLSDRTLPLLMYFLHRLGIEGLVLFKRDTQFDADQYTITVPSGDKKVTISVFDKVIVDIGVEKDKNTQRSRVKMMLVSPVDSRAL